MGPKKSTKKSAPPSPKDTKVSTIWRHMFHELNQSRDFASLAKSCLKNVDFDKLMRYVNTELCPDKSARLLPGQMTMGGSNLVQAIEWGDNERAIARIQLLPFSSDRSDWKKSELDTMRLLHEKSLPVPKLYGHSLLDETIGRSFEIMEFLPGNALVDMMQVATTHPHLFPGYKGENRLEDHLLRAIAEFQVRLTSIRMPKTGAIVRGMSGEWLVVPDFHLGGTYVSTRDFLEGWASRARFGCPEWVVRDECGEDADLVWNSACRFPSDVKRIAAILDEEEEFAGFGSGFPLTHRNLSAHKVIVDDEQHLIGVVDWDMAGTCPWALVDFPPLMHHRMNELAIYGVGLMFNENWHPEAGPVSDHARSAFQQLQKYLTYVREAEDKLGLDHNLSSSLGNKKLRALAKAIENFGRGVFYNYGVVLSMFENKEIVGPPLPPLTKSLRNQENETPHGVDKREGEEEEKVVAE